jgi:regulator of sirC expression with transglutaminase-like and TPR domain
VATDPRTAVLECAAAHDGDVAVGALWIAAEDCKGVDVAAGLAELDDIAGEVQTRLGAEEMRQSAAAIPVIASTLTDRLRLRPGPGKDPREHYMHTVLARGVGIPIACSVVWIGVGRRAGVSVEGVGLPGHFVVRVGGTLVDAQSGGEPLDEAATRRLIASAVGSAPEQLPAEWLRAASAREMLARISRNLRACHASGERWGMALRAADRCVALLPGESADRRERGLLRFRVGLPWPALDDLHAYLDAVPDASDREAVERIIATARGMLN